MQSAPTSFAGIRECCRTKPAADAAAARQAVARNAVLTKPPGSLGRLEDLAIWYMSWRRQHAAGIQAIQTLIFAGNHGVAARGVSAFSAEVTVQMVANFHGGGAAINQLVETLGGSLDVIALDLENPTNDFSKDPAMSVDETLVAFTKGWNAIDRAADLLIIGEMGIGNTTAASALCLALYGGDAGDWIGTGTGVGQDGLDRKRDLLKAAIRRHGPALEDPLGVLQCLGGREIAAMAGALAAARHASLPVVLDGFICTAAAAVLHRCAADMLDHVVAGHVSPEQAHRQVLELLDLKPILDLGMRLGEGSGAAVAAHVLKCAVACHTGMASFAEAGVSRGPDHDRPRRQGDNAGRGCQETGK